MFAPLINRAGSTGCRITSQRVPIPTLLADSLGCADIAVGYGRQTVLADLRGWPSHRLEVEAKLTGQAVMGGGVASSTSIGRTMHTSK